MQKILSHVRKAIDMYEMIEEGDRITVGVSGGKDSLVLLIVLNELKRFYPKKFYLEAVTITLGFDNFDLSGIQNLCDKLEINYTIKDTQIGEIIFDVRKEKNPCSLCSKMRNGVLHDVALELGCNKIALAHHNDDVIETFFLNLFFGGRIGCFSPVTYLDRKKVYVIRPMIYIPESKIKKFSEKYTLPVVKSPCPADGNTKREYIKQVIDNLSKENKQLKELVFGAIQRAEIDGWKFKKGL